MADNATIVIRPKAKDGPLADPSGWTSKPIALSSITYMFAHLVRAGPSDIGPVLGDKNIDQFVFCRAIASGPEIFYLHSSRINTTYQIVSPNTRKELWDVLGNDDWHDHLELKEVKKVSR